ncbi:PTS glucose transporter subunit IIA [Rubrobacter taiwanensis]|uniref:PTS glucose transporter subunit IIA n=1 Tax=Rubrobacter taiwanensis TaxID=185139 RepID=A0A4R1B636_9ACTN|nr:PTS glucose transporter subunit IIA [Rubrobacter taiwanensis]TCJ13050.1 PTS glucose transporter subunit IIA [Rubrobacter taiwanensis]
MEVKAPISGRVVPLSEVSDEVFAGGMAGDGVAIVPEAGGEAVAPVSGELVKLFEGGHAFGIVSDEGVELIVHLGLDTIELRGKGFERIAAEGDRVRAGQPIVRFDLDTIRDAGYEVVTPVVVSNSDEFPVSAPADGKVSAGDTLFRVKS